MAEEHRQLERRDRARRHHLTDHEAEYDRTFARLVLVLSPALFTPVWLDGVWSHTAIRDAVVAATSKPYLITTPLDSDDGLATTFVAELRAQFAEQDGLYVNFLRGVQVARSGQVFRYDHLSNPFISYFEKRAPGAPPRTVWQSFRHGQSPRMGPLLEIIGPPRWQVIHGSNLMNEVRGLRERPSVANRAFSLELPYARKVNPFTFHVGMDCERRPTRRIVDAVTRTREEVLRRPRAPLGGDTGVATADVGGARKLDSSRAESVQDSSTVDTRMN